MGSPLQVHKYVGTYIYLIRIALLTYIEVL